MIEVVILHFISTIFYIGMVTESSGILSYSYTAIFYSLVNKRKKTTFFDQWIYYIQVDIRFLYSEIIFGIQFFFSFRLTLRIEHSLYFTRIGYPLH